MLCHKLWILALSDEKAAGVDELIKYISLVSMQIALVINKTERKHIQEI